MLESQVEALKSQSQINEKIQLLEYMTIEAFCRVGAGKKKKKIKKNLGKNLAETRKKKIKGKKIGVSGNCSERRP
jgi:hypothetical protein